MFINCCVGQVSESWWIKFTWRYFHCSSDMFVKVSGSVINLIWEVLDSLCALSGNKKDKSLLECLRKRVFCHLWYSIGDASPSFFARGHNILYFMSTVCNFTFHFRLYFMEDQVQRVHRVCCWFLSLYKKLYLIQWIPIISNEKAWGIGVLDNEDSVKFHSFYE